MKIFLAILLALLIASPAQAEKLRPAGWTATGNNQTTGNPRVSGMQRNMTGNAVRTPEQEKAFRQKTAKALANGDIKTIKNTNGTTPFERKIVREGKRKTDSFWSNLFD